MLAVVVGVALRAGAVAWIPTRPVSDFWSYFLRGIHLAAYGRYETRAGIPSATFPPGYPLFLSVLFHVGGPSVIAAKIGNVLLAGIAGVLVALAGRRIAGPAAGAAAAFLFACLPRSILQACVLASENLFSPLLLGFLLALLWRERSPSLRGAALAGAMAGLMTLTRSVAEPAFLLWPAVGLVRRKRVGRLVVETAMVILVQHAVLLPWGLWNLRHFDRFTFLIPTGGANLYMGNSSRSTGRWYNWEPELRARHPELAGKSEYAVSETASRDAREWMRSHPRLAVVGYLRKLGFVFTDPDVIALWAYAGRDVSPPNPPVDVLPSPHPIVGYDRLVRHLLATVWTAIVIGAIAGALWLASMAIRRRDPLAWGDFVAVAGAALLSPLASALFIVASRHRWPTEDCLCVLAAIPMARFVGRLSRPVGLEEARPPRYAEPSGPVGISTHSLSPPS